MKHPNRIKARQRKRGAAWCMRCDRVLTLDGAKCPECGYREVKRSKKHEPEE